jgi:hypothetical protein
MPIIILPRTIRPGASQMASNRQRKLTRCAYPARAKTMLRPLVLAAEPSMAAPARTIFRKIAVFLEKIMRRNNNEEIQKRRDYVRFRSTRSRYRTTRPPQTAGGWPSMRVLMTGRLSHR